MSQPTSGPGLENICYAHNFLKRVIVRLDFVSPLASVSQAIPDKVFHRVVKTFALPEPREIHAQQIEIKPGEPPAGRETGVTKEWRFHSKDRLRTLCFSESYLWIEEKAYSRYGQLRADLQDVITALQETGEQLQPARLGLRYVNVIDDDLRTTDEWRGLIDPRALAVLEILDAEERSDLSEFVTTLDLTRDLCRIRMRAGQHNPSRPAKAPGGRTQFSIDIDAFSTDIDATRAVPETLDLFHKEIQGLFERLITQRLREMLLATPTSARSTRPAEGAGHE